MKKVDPAVQAQVDAQLMEQGAFSPLEHLMGSGRLMYADYESWRRREIEFLDSVLMGNTARVQAEIEEAVAYARSIGLVEQPQEYSSWRTDGDPTSDKPLRISANLTLHRLIGTHYAPAQAAPQLDLFFDNPVVALANGIVQALSARNRAEAQRRLDHLYLQAPNHADLAAFDRLLTALGHIDQTIGDPSGELSFLQDIAPIAKRLLGAQSRDLLSPLWRQLADALKEQPFLPERPTLHRSFALSQAQDWLALKDCVLTEPGWNREVPLCLRLAESGFYRRSRKDSLTAWSHLCWNKPSEATSVLDTGKQPDASVIQLWQEFSDEAELMTEQAAADAPMLTAPQFPAWLLLKDPELATQLPIDIAGGDTDGEAQYRCVHQWVHARKAKKQDEELSLRKTLQASHPLLLQMLKRSVS